MKARCDSPFSLMETVMARALSDDLRRRVLEAGVGGASARLLAAQFGVGISPAIRSGCVGNVRAASGRPVARANRADHGWTRMKRSLPA